MRGEYYCHHLARSSSRGSPPLARGILREFDFAISEIGITPACAGNTHFRMLEIRERWDHPRLRGEYHCLLLQIISPKGSPPLARGIHSRRCIYRGVRGITPACAGNTTSVDSATVILWDHPRLRGEYRTLIPNTLGTMGSPPLARGIRDFLSCCVVLCGITPACAGNTVDKCIDCDFLRDHPRLRGEY